MEATACKQAAKTTATAILAAGAMIAAAVYFKPMPGRYHMLKDDVGVRLDTATGTLDRCGRVASGGAESLPGIPADKLRMFRLDPNGYNVRENFDQAFGAGAADKALEGTRWSLDCARWEDWP